MKDIPSNEGTMHVEVSVALNFVISYLYNKLPRRRVDMFGEDLEQGMRHKFEGHWYAEQPYKGSAYRCMRISGERVDPVITDGAISSGLDLDEINQYLPKDLTVWIDPGEVSYRIGEKGIVKVLYSAPRDNDVHQGVDREIVSASRTFNPDAQSFNPDARCFKPIDSLSSSLSSISVSSGNSLSPSTPNAQLSPGSSSPWGAGSLSPIGQPATTSPALSPIASYLNRHQQPTTMTTAMFAQTKFGSTKLKSQGKRPARLSPTEWGSTFQQRAPRGPPLPSPAGQPLPHPMPNSMIHPFNPHLSQPHGTNAPSRPQTLPLNPHLSLKLQPLDGSTRLPQFYVMKHHLSSPVYGSEVHHQGLLSADLSPSHFGNLPGLQEVYPSNTHHNPKVQTTPASSAAQVTDSNLSRGDVGINPTCFSNYGNLQHLLLAN